MVRYLQNEHGLDREQRRRQCTRTHGPAGTTTLLRRIGKRRRRGNSSSLDGGGRSRVFEFRQRTFTNVTSVRTRKDVGQGAHTFHYPTLSPLPVIHTGDYPPLFKPPRSSLLAVLTFLPAPSHPQRVSVLYTLQYTYNFNIFFKLF
ncbi:unnamed protein product [Aphis gossypii]|uniref:Uncharacterized protein n=1 Tax=Aphis gossypii TaxID=80765 RepID=A0A9P0J2F4_APHGO|nr:unnamed protein product [Aphis gossypii]